MGVKTSRTSFLHVNRSYTIRRNWKREDM